ncbi:MAG: heavy metal translocating P-type ATPase, partial [Candidatus Accumulibacter sp.]|nr:heavy metal translocating P-type ATPase [Accumulibacter sp.]
MEKTYELTGLCCPQCAEKIEKRVMALEGVAFARVDFLPQKLTIEAKDASGWDDIVARAGRIIEDIEPSAKLRASAPFPSREAANMEEAASKKEKRRLAFAIVGFALFAVGMACDFLAAATLSPRARLAIFLASYVLVGGEIILKAMKNIARGEVFDENFLMSVATLGAFAIGEYPEGAAVMIFYRVGEAFQDHAVGRSR